MLNSPRLMNVEELVAAKKQHFRWSPKITWRNSANNRTTVVQYIQGASLQPVRQNVKTFKGKKKTCCVFFSDNWDMEQRANSD